MITVRGGGCIAFGCLWSEEQSPDETLHFMDRTSQYAYIGLMYEFPTSTYQVSSFNFVL